MGVGLGNLLGRGMSGVFEGLGVYGYWIGLIAGLSVAAALLGDGAEEGEVIQEDGVRGAKFLDATFGAGGCVSMSLVSITFICSEDLSTDSLEESIGIKSLIGLNSAIIHS